jgi:hypothetical protein
VEYDHASVDDIECQVLRPADFRSNDLVEDRHFFCAIKTADLKTPARSILWHGTKLFV